MWPVSSLEFSSASFQNLNKTTVSSCCCRHPELPCAVNSIWNIQAVRPLLLFNCGNRNTVTGLQAGTAMNFSSISNRGRRLSVVQNMQIEIGIHQQFYWIGQGIKQPVLEGDNHQQPNPKMNGEPAVTSVTVRIAAVRDSCAVILC